MQIIATGSQHCCAETDFIRTGIRVNVQFGDPKKRCAGSGICTIKLASVTSGQGYEKQCSAATAYILGTEPNSIAISFIKASMAACTSNHYFGGGEFLIEEEYKLPDTIAKKLQLPFGQVQKGIYSIKETQNYYTIRLIIH